VPNTIKTIKINASPLIELVESEKFISKKLYCNKKIKQTLKPLLSEKADVAILSSTHLPFLLPLLQKNFPNVKFLDPGDIVADKVLSILKYKKSRFQKLKIFASGDSQEFQKKLQRIGMKYNVESL